MGSKYQDSLFSTPIREAGKALGGRSGMCRGSLGVEFGFLASFSPPP